MNAEKYCKRCGALIAREETCDYFAYIRLKYCRPCAADVRRMQIAESMRKARAAARERRQLEKEQQQLTCKENDLLREIVQRQREQILMLESALQHGKQ